MGYPVVHFEILTDDPASAQEFYKEQFGWDIQLDAALNYGVIQTGATEADNGTVGINGGIGPSIPEMGQKVTFYVQVDDINAQLLQIEASGGSTLMGRTDLGMVVLGIFSDPQGNVIGLVEAQAGQQPDSLASD